MYKNCGVLLSSAGLDSGDVSMVFFSCAASRMYKNARSLARGAFTSTAVRGCVRG